MAKTMNGIVTSAVNDKTITVTVTSRETHPIYGKQYTVTRKYAVHDPKNSADKGDRVIFTATRPQSKSKAHEIVSIVEKAKGSIELKADEVEEK